MSYGFLLKSCVVMNSLFFILGESYSAENEKRGAVISQRTDAQRFQEYSRVLPLNNGKIFINPAAKLTCELNEARGNLKEGQKIIFVERSEINWSYGVLKTQISKCNLTRDKYKNRGDVIDVWLSMSTFGPIIVDENECGLTSEEESAIDWSMFTDPIDLDTLL